MMSISMIVCGGIVLLAAGCAGVAPGTNPAALPTTRPIDRELLRLWEGPAPHATGQSIDDVPTLSVYRPAAGDARDLKAEEMTFRL